MNNSAALIRRSPPVPSSTQVIGANPNLMFEITKYSFEVHAKMCGINRRYKNWAGYHNNGLHYWTKYHYWEPEVRKLWDEIREMFLLINRLHNCYSFPSMKFVATEELKRIYKTNFDELINHAQCPQKITMAHKKLALALNNIFLDQKDAIFNVNRDGPGQSDYINRFFGYIQGREYISSEERALLSDAFLVLNTYNTMDKWTRREKAKEIMYEDQIRQENERRANQH